MSEPFNIHQFTAVIFDCDGVLINSEEIVQQLELEHLARHGVYYAREEFTTRYTGTADDEFFEMLNQDCLDQTGKPLPETFREELSHSVSLAFENRLQAVEHAHTFVSRWQGNKAVASSSGQERLHRKLTATGLADLFGEHIYSADTVGRGKPAPDIFLHTAENLAVDARQCLVIEDSVNGILAARAAGMQVIGFLGGGHLSPDYANRHVDAGADLVAENFQELLNLLQVKDKPDNSR